MLVVKAVAVLVNLDSGSVREIRVAVILLELCIA